MADGLPEGITGWLLAGGEGRRMQGQDKGLVPYNGRPLAAWVLDCLRPQCTTVHIGANRNLPDYKALLYLADSGDQTVWPDDANLPPQGGPLAGILTALRHAKTEWLLVAPCDAPHLPEDLAKRLLAHAKQTNADIVIPCTQKSDEEPRYHWVCGLIHTRVCPDTEALFAQGERKVGNWVRSQRWSSVSFDDLNAFANMNTLETLRGRA